MVSVVIRFYLLDCCFLSSCLVELRTILRVDCEASVAGMYEHTQDNYVRGSVWSEFF